MFKHSNNYSKCFSDYLMKYLNNYIFGIIIGHKLPKSMCVFSM
jgi:hypothetical protein